jgi:hypothetical protein
MKTECGGGNANRVSSEIADSSAQELARVALTSGYFRRPPSAHFGYRHACQTDPNVRRFELDVASGIPVSGIAADEQFLIPQ